MIMKSTIRGFIACILPCGALDVIRIVHVNGRVEEITGTILASEVMKAHPKHILKKPSSSPSDHQGCCPRIVIVPPDAELRRGKIYFLMPFPSSTTPDHRHQKTRSRKKKKKKETQKSVSNLNSGGNSNNVFAKDLVVPDRYLSEILSEKLSTQKDRRRGRAAVWRPRLESISETPSEI